MKSEALAVIGLLGVVVVILLGVILTSRSSSDSFKPPMEQITTETGKKVIVEWVEINPPPGEPGPCYAFFYTNASGYGFTYSGVHCLSSEIVAGS